MKRKLDRYRVSTKEISAAAVKTMFPILLTGALERFATEALIPLLKSGKTITISIDNPKPPLKKRTRYKKT